MKKHVSLIAIGFVVVFSAGPLRAQEESKQKPVIPETRGDRKKLLQERLRSRNMKSEEQTKQMDRGMRRKRHLGRLDEEIDGKKKSHAEFISELKAIKELALKERAEKTAKRLDMLINAKNKEFSETIGNARQMRNRLDKQSANDSEKPPEPEKIMLKHADPAKKPIKEEKEDTKEAEGNDKWWQFWK